MRKFGYFKIGLFVISAILIGISGVIALGLGSIFQKKNLAETYIEESVQGLDVGSPVKFRGVSIGKVEQITLTSVEYPTRHRYVLVRFDISPNIFGFPVGDKSDKALEDELQYGFRVRLAAQGLTGVAYIEADYLDPDRNLALEIDWRPKYPYIPSAPSRITQLSESVERILRNVEELDIPQLTGSVEKSLAAMTKLAEGANLEQIGRQANALLSEIRDTNRQLGVLVHAPELKSALADTAAAAGTARKLMENAEKPVGQLLTDLPRVSESISHMALRLEAVTADLPQTSSQFQQTLQQLNRLIVTQQEQIQSTLESLRSVTEDIQEFANESRKYPSQILFGAPPPRSEVFGR
jgi:phospholipid/cholesterol/gamma-HCH transport system substrate-binding protein/paraquat-inducible protein B